ncbi:Arabinose 5-phosphate isomerase KdsD [Candidatus Sulfobium mesophilum]|uniref:Arabinose 5-phosphate isomerase KdsD n=1 Tax=Candidatus Sulfobium mesophilum TaxID=2016548 RepID=A0A2U3QE83_9BACT|nr:Arabinose 5-phosphate isomerase KdsD [Candidatus Sulfobium mesophilum]
MSDSQMEIIEIARKVLRTEAEAVASLIEKLDSNFEKVIDLIYDCHGRVIVTGMGKSGLVGKKVAATLASTGTPAFFMHPAEASHGDLGMVTSDDVIIAISYSGETEELLGIIPFLKRFNVRLVSITGNLQSTLSRSADISLDISVKEEACPMGIVPTASTTAAMAAGDAIAVALLIKRGFREEDFALFHPRGSLGKKLLVKVSDLMHTGDALPLTSPDVPMTSAVMEISTKRLGITVIADADKKILGIVTDGDIRRGIERWGKNFFDMTAEEVMTKNPRTISADELAAKAISVMEKHSITSLLVPDKDGRALGVIHLHDILRQGIV